MRLIIVRHGETEDNRKRILQGHLPTELSKKGFEQAEAVATRLSGRDLDVIYTSDLPRARQTAEIISKYHPNTKMVLDKRLRERDFGDYAGKVIDSITWPSDPNTKIPRGESLADQRRRLKEIYEEILEKHANDTVLLVTHGGSILLLMSVIQVGLVENLDFSYRIKNTSVTEFEIAGGVKPVTINCDKHLGV